MKTWPQSDKTASSLSILAHCEYITNTSCRTCHGKVGPHHSWSPEPFILVHFGPLDHFCKTYIFLGWTVFEREEVWSYGFITEFADSDYSCRPDECLTHDINSICITNITHTGRDPPPTLLNPWAQYV